MKSSGKRQYALVLELELEMTFILRGLALASSALCCCVSGRCAGDAHALRVKLTQLNRCCAIKNRKLVSVTLAMIKVTILVSVTSWCCFEGCETHRTGRAVKPSKMNLKSLIAS